MATVRFTQAQLFKINRKRKNNVKADCKDNPTLHTKSTRLEIVTDKICSKPRMTRSVAWKSKTDKTLIKYWAWVDEIKWSYKKAKGLYYNQPITLGFEFHLPVNTRRDLDNIIKGCKDALKKLAYPDDCIKYIRGYDYVIVKNISKSESEKLILIIKPM